MWGDISIAFLLAFITAFVITPYTIRLANRVGAVDKPEKRRINQKTTPKPSNSYSHIIEPIPMEIYGTPIIRRFLRLSSLDL